MQCNFKCGCVLAAAEIFVRSLVLDFDWKRSVCSVVVVIFAAQFATGGPVEEDGVDLLRGSAKI